MLQALPILGSDCDRTLDGLAIEIEGRLFASALVKLDIDCLAIIGIVKYDVDVDRCREEEGRHCRQPYKKEGRRSKNVDQCHAAAPDETVW